jgi:hypothetical protein
MLSALVIGLSLVQARSGEEIVFPNDPKAVVDVKRDCGAKGDGMADDTDALQQAVYRCWAGDFSRTIYLPNGTYRITRPLVFRPSDKAGEGAMVGPWIYGQQRDKTVIRLADKAEGYGDPANPKEAIRGCSRPDGARMNADFFDRTVVNLTLDCGDNPGAIGMKYFSNNTGLLSQVRIVGNGVCGIELGSHDQNGPHLIQDVEIAGFETGIRTGHGINSQTLSRVTVTKAKLGLRHRGQVLAVEGLTVLGAPLAVDSDEGVLTLVDCRFEGPAGTRGPAVTLGGKGYLYAQRMASKGYSTAIAAAGKEIAGPTVAEFSSHGTTKVDVSASSAGLGIKPLSEPVVPIEKDPKKWVCANDFGAKFADEEDDADAIQKAVDHAASIGATTVYLRGGKGGDPNWYWLKKDVKIHGSVERVWGFGFIRLLGGPSDAATYPENLSKFVVEDDPKGAPVVVFEHLQVFAPWPSFGIDVRSKKRTVVCRTMGGTPIARAGSRLFMTNCVGHAYIEPGAAAYLRQWNTEGTPKTLRVNTRNDGGTLWILGMKTEGDGTKVLTRNKGRTEILGTLIYNTSGIKDDTPCLSVEDASMSSAGHREVCFVGQWWKVPVLEKLAGAERRLASQPWLTWSLFRAGK